jgi:4-diphosphocytidyl-2C-methyl-D-erythritol kinase
VRGDLQLTERCRNDLEEPAQRVEPRLATLWAALERLVPGGGLRMSGSGSTLFYARRDAHEADELARRLRAHFDGESGWPDLRILRSRTAEGLPQTRPTDARPLVAALASGHTSRPPEGDPA